MDRLRQHRPRTWDLIDDLGAREHEPTMGRPDTERELRDDRAAAARRLRRAERRRVPAAVPVLEVPDAGEHADGLARDPVIATAVLLVNSGLVGPDEVLARYDEIGWQVRRVAEEVIAEPKLGSADRSMASSRC